MQKIIAAMALATAPFIVQAAEPRVLPQMSGQEVQAAGLAGATGRAIFLHDRAAAVASDALGVLTGGKRDGRVRGWITEDKQGSVVVTFYDAAPAALYRIEVDARGKLAASPAALDSPQTLSAFEAGAVAARALASKASFERCAQNYNTVVLPASAGQGWTVYMLPAATRSSVIPLGGAVRVDTDGQRITAQRAFSRSCIALQADAKAVAMMTTHLLDPLPTETHVFWSLWSRRPIYVSMPHEGTLWEVNSDQLTLISRDIKP